MYKSHEKTISKENTQSKLDFKEGVHYLYH